MLTLTTNWIRLGACLAMTVVASCDRQSATTANRPSRSAEAERTPPQAQPDPEEAARLARREAYRSLAGQLADPLWTSPQPPPWRKEPDQLRAEMQVRIAQYQSIQTDDRAVMMAAAEAAAAGIGMIEQERVLQVVSKDAALGKVVLGGFAAYLGNPMVLLSAASGLFDEGRSEHVERIKWAQAFGRSRTAQLMLPDIASKYCTTPAPRPGVLVCDFDESFGGNAASDAISIVNNAGRDLHHCLVCVEVRSVNGDTRRNVHFVPRWEAKGTRFAQYGIGFQTPGGVLGQQTVYGVQELAISIWADELVEVGRIYAYSGPERDRDVESHLKAATFRWHYRRVPFLTQGPTVYMTLDGVASLPEGRVTMRFHPQKGEEHGQSWNVKGWERGRELSFDTQRALKFDPAAIDVEISFTNIGYKHRIRLDHVKPD